MNRNDRAGSLKVAAAALLVACGVWLHGCNSELDCTDLGCDPGLVCEQSTGRCVEQENDCRQQGCPVPKTCNRETGECEIDSQSCDEGRSCPRGQVCNGSTQYCVPDSRCTAGSCGAAARCDQESGECGALRCQDDSRCPRGYICDSSGRCSSGCRTDAPNCPFGQSCWQTSPSSPGECRDECSADTDCPHGQFCQKGSGQPVCQPEGPCTSGRDCRDDEICRNGTCTAPPCESDDACPNKQVCDVATGLCVGGDCSEDEFAPNATPQEATALHFEKFTGLQLCPGRSDWFALEVDADEAVTLRLSHETDRDLDFTIFGEDGDVMATNQQPPSPGRRRASSSLAVLPDRPQTLRIRVYSNSRTSAAGDDETPVPVGATYDLTVERAADLLCRDDRFEQNDTREEAETLASSIGSSSTLLAPKICGGDEDWFALPDVPRRAQIEARIDEEDAPHLRLDLYAEDGAHYRRSPVETFDLWRNASRQTWYLRVGSRRELSGDYTLDYTVSAPWECPHAGVSDSADQALSLPPGETNSHLLCPLDDEWEDDWFALDAPDSARYLELQVTESEASPPLQVRMFERLDDRLALVRTTNEQNGLHRAVLDVDPSRELLVHIGSEAEPGNLTDQPEYDIVYDYLGDGD